MNNFRNLSLATFVLAIISCTSASSDKEASDSCDINSIESNGAHNHIENCSGHHHETVIVGIAQNGDYKSGKITITTIPDNEIKEFNYINSNQDKIAAWQAGDTVSIFVNHHHHGNVAHDSITAIKFGIKSNTCNLDHGHNHEHHDHGHNH